MTDPSPCRGDPPPSMAVINACHPGAWQRVGGISLTARTLSHLRDLGMERVAVISSTGRIPEDLGRWQGDLELLRVALKEDIPTTILSIGGLDHRFVYIDSAHLMDVRLMRALVASSRSTLAYIRPADREEEVIRAGLLTWEDLHIWTGWGKARLIRQSGSLFPDDVDPFSPEIRGAVTPYFMEVRSEGEAREATRILIRSQQKQVMDLPAQFIDPPFENALTLWLCNTPVTPNMVTLFGVAVALAVAWLFWNGHLLAGALGVFVVEILDGVDGKLARTKLHFTRLGRHEDVIDYFCENSWYVALAVSLSGLASSRWPYGAAGLLILSDTADNILYTLAGRWYGKSIDLFSGFDRAFRRVAGRRNIYGWMFIIGFSLGYPLATFLAVTAWATLTAGIHTVRLMQYGRAGNRQLGPQAEGA